MSLDDARYGIFVSIVENESDTFFSLFESNHVEINAPLNKYEWTALQTAAYTGNIQIVHYLLHKGADTTITNKRGLSALDMANENGHLEIAELLSDCSSSVYSGNGEETSSASSSFIQLACAPYEREEQFESEE